MANTEGHGRQDLVTVRMAEIREVRKDWKDERKEHETHAKATRMHSRHVDRA